MLSHVHWSFLKKGCLLISSTPLRPRRTSLRGGEVFAFEQLNRLHDSGTPVIHARLFQCSGCLNKQNIYWFPTCQSRKHRWDFWHHWKCHCHPGRSGHSCGSWFYCKSPPMSLRRKAYRLCTRQSKIKSNNFSYMTLTYFVVNSGFIIKQLKKKRLTNKHLIKKHSYWPPVTLSAIVAISSLGFQYLRWNVVWSSNCCVTLYHPILTGKKYQNHLIILLK